MNADNPVRILIVEDEAIAAFALKQELSQPGYTFCPVAASGDKAVEIAKTERPDVVLMDIRLKGAMDGIEAARRIRQFSSAKIIFVSGYADPDIRQRAFAISPAFLNKPLRGIEVLAMIKTMGSTTTD
jgi:CheY-like chemotaxis protein